MSGGRGARSRERDLVATSPWMLAGIAVLLIVACGPGDGDDEGAAARQRHELSGEIVSADPGRGTITVAHDEIPGFMPAMQMPFPVERPELLEGLRMGDRVDFHLRVTDGTSLITDLVKLPGYLGPLPAFQLEDTSGSVVSSSEFLGKVTVVNFWASWCTPCKTEMPILNQMTLDYPEDDFAVVGITQDPQSREAIDQILADLEIRYPILMSDGALEVGVGGVPVIPGTLVVDREGNVVEERLGIFDEAELRAVIEGLF